MLGALLAAMLVPGVAHAAPLTACFTVSPSSPLTNETATLDSSCSSDDPGVIKRSWDLDDDGRFDDGHGIAVTRSWPAPGTYTVRLRVREPANQSDVATRTITVGNRPPVASFTISPASIVEGDAVTLTSTSRDPDGTLSAEEWDLDNDGAYDDALGAGASLTAGPPGNYTVGLRVVDNRNEARTATRTFSVGERPGQPPPLELPVDSGPANFDISTPVVPTPSPAESPLEIPVSPVRYLMPFPVVRMRGRTMPGGVRLTVFSVRAPHGSLAELRCVGRGCPLRRTSKRVTSPRERGSATIHFRQVERFLPAGIELQVRVTQEGMVGKYTRLRIRRRGVPLRSDRCLLPNSTRPVACPAAQ